MNNKRTKFLLSMATFFLFQGVSHATPDLPLLQRTDLVHKGAFRVPTGRYGTVSTHSNSFSTDSGRALSYNPLNNSLFMVGRKDELLLAELNIPSKIVNSTSKSDLTFATVRQNPVEITGGHGCFVGPDGTSKCYNQSSLMTAGNVLIGGTLFDSVNNKLIGTTYVVYNGEADATLSHFTANGNWSTSVNGQGMYRVGTNINDNNALSAGFVDGYMTWIPTEWQKDFGGTALTGNAAQAIITRTSYGPSAFVFNPSDLGNGLGTESNPASATPLVYYPSTHQTLGAYSNPNANPTFTSTTEITGIVFPSGTRTVLFFGRTGLGSPCYGSGTITSSQAANNATIQAWIAANGGSLYQCGSSWMDGLGNDDCCYDPSAASSKGVHSWPYAYYAWAYDALDLLKVKNGTINPGTGRPYQPWEIVPYATWNLNSDLEAFAPKGDDGIAGHGTRRIFGSAYDPATQSIYLTQSNGDAYTYEMMPMIQVYQVQIGATTAADTISPVTSIASPVGGSSVSGAVSVAATATDNVGVTKVELYANGILQASDTSAPYAFSWNTSSLVNGVYTLTTKAYDAAGNVGQAPAVSVTVNNPVPDTIAPTVSMTAPANGATISGTALVTASASDNVGVTKIEFYQNGTLMYASNVTPYSYSWDTTSVVNGSYALTAKAYDAAGNVSQSSGISVAVKNPVPDTTAPTVSVTAPAANAIVSGTTTVTASASDNVGVTKVEFYINGILQATSSSGPYSFSWNTSNSVNGSYTVTAKAYDAAGNVGQSSSVPVTVNNDVTAPVATITSPTSNTSVRGTVTVNVTASDNVGVTKIELYGNGALIAVNTVAPSLSLSTSFSFPVGSLPLGVNTLVAKAYDAAGNRGQSSSVSFTVVDSTPPVITISSPVGGSKVGSSVTISTSATDNVGVTKMNLYLDGVFISTVSGNSLNWTWKTSSYAVGSHMITVRAWDAANNVVSKSVTVYK